MYFNMGEMKIELPKMMFGNPNFTAFQHGWNENLPCSCLKALGFFRSTAASSTLIQLLSLPETSFIPPLILWNHGLRIYTLFWNHSYGIWDVSMVVQAISTAFTMGTAHPYLWLWSFSQQEKFGPFRIQLQAFHGHFRHGLEMAWAVEIWWFDVGRPSRCQSWSLGWK